MSLRAEESKWATIQAYYSTFHSARALLYTKEYAEHGHRALLAALRALYARELPSELLDHFEDAMGLREAADYGSVYSQEGAEEVIETARSFLDAATRILKVSPASLRLSPGHQDKLVREGIRELEREHRKEARKLKAKRWPS
jgi:uncharacterized protein (UPF0332 family)